MKLLSPSETKTKRETTNAALESRGNTLDETLVSKKNELLALEREFILVLEKQRSERLKEETDWGQRNSALRSETEDLEARRKRALVPLEQTAKELEDRVKVLLQREQKVSYREDETTINLELVELRLDEASERLESVKQQEKRLSKREQGIKLQESETVRRTNEFNTVLADSLASLQKERQELDVIRTEQTGKMTILIEWEKRLLSQEKELVSRETLLADRYKTLERAAKEIETKKKHG